MSHRELSDLIAQKMEQASPEVKGEDAKIHPSDISQAENAESAYKFQKVAKAITKYFSLPEQFFGEFSQLPATSDRSDNKEKILDLMQQLLDANKKYQAAMDEKYVLLVKILDLEKKVLELEEQLREKKN